MPKLSRQLLCHPEFERLELHHKQMALIALRVAHGNVMRMRSSTLDGFISVTGDFLVYRPACIRQIATALNAVHLPSGLDEEALASLSPKLFAAQWLFDDEGREQIKLSDLLAELNRGATSPLKQIVADSIAHLEDDLGDGPLRSHGFSSLDHLAALLELNEYERSAMFVALLRSDSRGFYELLRSQDASNRKEALRMLGMALGHDPYVFTKELGHSSRLYEYGILDRENRVSDLSDVFDISDDFMQLLLQPHATQEEFVQSFLRRAAPATLTASDYPHMTSAIEEAIRVVRGALHANTPGIHVMLYGEPGTGKTAFARMLANELGACLYEVDCQDQDGSASSRSSRYSFLRIAQQFLSCRQNNVILFDEAEDAFPCDSGFDFFASLSGKRRHSHRDANKAWMNRFLETSPVPVIWASNHIDQIDPANLRRFTYHLHFDAPPKQVRKAIASRYLTDLPVTEQFADRLGEFSRLLPAQLEAASRFARLAGPRDSADAETLVLSQLQKSSRAIGLSLERTRSRCITNYRPDFLNLRAAYTPDEIVTALQRTGSATLCLYGISGTGKTEFGAHIAQALGRELIIKSASDLLSMWVGGTEKNIRAMFEEADDLSRPSVLLLDEADALLRDRSGAQRSWEVSQVNEFLCRMEAFSGIFICTSNLFDDIDQALLRRFTFKLEFLPLTAQQRKDMFASEFPHLCAPPDLDSVLQRVGSLDGLVPGDFATVKRQLILLGTRQTADQTLVMLEEEMRIRARASTKRGIGFM